MNKGKTIGQCLEQIYERLDGYFGDLKWWPGETPFEIIVGAILTQNTAWKNVTYAIGNLKQAGVLDPISLHALPIDTLATLIRSSGYYNVKARRLAAFLNFLHDEYNGSLKNLFSEDHRKLRKKILNIKGIGEETADSILLYAGKKPVFVVDAYTKRILERHGLISGRAGYADIQKLFMDNLPQSVPLYNQYHALIVNTGKTFCKKDKKCETCPLRNLAK